MEHSSQQRARPESIVARNFSDDLDSLFGLNSGTTLGNLSFTVEEKSVLPQHSLSMTECHPWLGSRLIRCRKRTVSTREEELAAIEARLRETEQRLAQAAHTPEHESTSQQAAPGAQPSYTSRETIPRQASGYQSHAEQEYQARPSNNRQESFRPHIPGAMPMTPTPQYSQGQDYVTVDRTR
ncbi:hypothetical protein E4T44_00342 [Aureobasidium sp. EXF-8845]|nr:hypothetical protein E4T44_00342 [Aureobasidium sp. EXF-8845]KAI4858162.1 hypothetical protein E4T45_00325 [Aureobasidium sp. EXF-8846]